MLVSTSKHVPQGRDYQNILELELPFFCYRLKPIDRNLMLPLSGHSLPSKFINVLKALTSSRCIDRDVPACLSLKCTMGLYSVLLKRIFVCFEMRTTAHILI